MLDLKEFHEMHGVEHLVPNQVLSFFEFFRERERRKFFCFQRLAKAFIGADSKKLKMRRVPPTFVLHANNVGCWI
jgi:hypothetical protein